MTLSDRKVRSFDLEHFLCCGGNGHGGTLLAAGEAGVGLYDRDFNLIKSYFSPPFDAEILRFNDGKIGPDGSFWAGSMSYEGDRPIGGLFRFTDTVSCILDGMIIPNGLGWSPDGETMYITDSGRSVIERWDYDRELGIISNGSVFVDASDLEGVPDGMTVDGNGNVWSAFWGGNRVLGFTPNGEIFAEIPVEAVNPSCCSFCGPDLSELYITSARHGLETAGPGDGALYRALTGTKGMPPFEFAY